MRDGKDDILLEGNVSNVSPRISRTILAQSVKYSNPIFSKEEERVGPLRRRLSESWNYPAEEFLRNFQRVVHARALAKIETIDEGETATGEKGPRIEQLARATKRRREKAGKKSNERRLDQSESDRDETETKDKRKRLGLLKRL